MIITLKEGGITCLDRWSVHIFNNKCLHMGIDVMTLVMVEKLL